MDEPPLLPLSTPRLVLRALRETDAPVIHAYRNDPVVARHQDWGLPFSLGAAERLVAEQAEVGRVRPGDWVQLGVEHAGTLVGDVAIGRDRAGTGATVGYTLGAAHWGKGYATEAVGALIDHLLGHGVQRVDATVDPLNLRSARLLDRLGFDYAGRAVRATLVRGAWTDDDRYALTTEARARWLARPRNPPLAVRLVEVSETNRSLVAGLTTHHTQERFVATMAGSFADAADPEMHEGAPVVPWMRAIEADDEVAGFLMTAEPRWPGEDPYLWRLLIDRRHQRRGIGRRAIGSLVERLRAQGHRRLVTSWVRDEGGPEPFYLGLGFRLTGEIDGGEHVAELPL